jgi:hypothetical protein
LLSHAKAPLREEKRDAATHRYQHSMILSSWSRSAF